jgi:hypothetical protein
MTSAAASYVSRRIVGAPVREDPFPHIYVEDVFPAEIYSALRAAWPPLEEMRPLVSTGRVRRAEGFEDGDLTRPYQNRYVLRLEDEDMERLPDPCRPFWDDLSAWLLGRDFTVALLQKFGPYFPPREPGPEPGLPVLTEAMLTRDLTGYGLGPHSDHEQRLLSLMFYCPPDDSTALHGTSLYVPRDPAASYPGGGHYDFSEFRRVATMPFRPNTAFAFVKRRDSFHGVEPVTEPDVARDLILYIMRTSLRMAGNTKQGIGNSE